MNFLPENLIFSIFVTITKSPLSMWGVYWLLFFPLKTLEKTEEAIDLALEVLKIGNVNCISDAAVASEIAYSAAYGAYYNVRINLLDLKKEKSYSNQINHKIMSIISDMDNKILKIRALVEKDLSCE